jgi:ketosteroid isomerase-like protein
MAAPDPADRLAIDRLIAQYCEGVLRKDTALWGSVWTEDARWDLSGGRVMEGRDTIVSTWEQAMARFAMVMQTAPTGLVDIDEGGDTATGRWFVTEHFRLADGTAGGLWACYHDRYVRTVDGWRISERVLEVLDRA